MNLYSWWKKMNKKMTYCDLVQWNNKMAGQTDEERGCRKEGGQGKPR